MRSIHDAIIAKKKSGHAALVPYITFSDPDIETTKSALEVLSKAGAAVIELGLPFSDPVADGPTIQKASERALANGFSLNSVFRMVRELRDEGNETPIALYTYANLIFSLGYDEFYENAMEAGIDGTLIVDLPPEEANNFVTPQARPLETIFLCSPTTTRDRLTLANNASTGFTYYVAHAGVTGVRDELPPDIVAKLQSLREIITTPLGVGFGISRPEHAKALAPHTDAVVIGSAYVNLFEQYRGELLMRELQGFTEAMVAAL